MAETTFILDTSFLRRLSRFELYADRKKSLGMPSLEEDPVKTLRHLSKQPAGFILPNEVLSEMTTMAVKSSHGKWGQLYRKQGLALSKKGRAYFDPKGFSEIPENSEMKPFLYFLRELQRNGRLRCFASVDEYDAARKAESLDGIVSIVPGTPLEEGASGYHYHMPKHKRNAERVWVEKGDEEIIALRRQLTGRDTHEADSAYCLLTNDKRLGKRFCEEHVLGNQWLITANARMYLHMMERIGYPQAAVLKQQVNEYEQECQIKPILPPKNAKELARHREEYEQVFNTLFADVNRSGNYEQSYNKMLSAFLDKMEKTDEHYEQQKILAEPLGDMGKPMENLVDYFLTTQGLGPHAARPKSFSERPENQRQDRNDPDTFRNQAGQRR